MARCHYPFGDPQIMGRLYGNLFREMRVPAFDKQPIFIPLPGTKTCADKGCQYPSNSMTSLTTSDVTTSRVLLSLRLPTNSTAVPGALGAFNDEPYSG